MKPYPTQLNTSPKMWKVCHISDCGACFKTYDAVVKHIQSCHLVTRDEMAGHWLLAARQSEQRQDALGEREGEFAGLARHPDGDVAEDKFKCLACDKILSNRACALHMDGHSVDPDKVSGWLTVKDSRTISNAVKANADPSTTRLRLTQALLNLTVGSSESAGSGAHMRVAGVQAREEAQQIKHENESGQASAGEPFVWRPWPCLVKVNSVGKPVVPLEIKFTEGDARAPTGATPKPIKQRKRDASHSPAPAPLAACGRVPAPILAAATGPNTDAEGTPNATPAMKNAGVTSRQAAATSGASAGVPPRGATKRLRSKTPPALAAAHTPEKKGSAGGSLPEASTKAKRARRTKAEMDAARAAQPHHASRVVLGLVQQTYVLTKWNETHSAAASLHGLLPWFTELVQQGARDNAWELAQAPTAKGLCSLIRRVVFDGN